MAATSLRAQVRNQILNVIDVILAKENIDLDALKRSSDEAQSRIQIYEKTVALDKEFEEHFELERSFAQEQAEIEVIRKMYAEIDKGLIESAQLTAAGKFKQAQKKVTFIKKELIQDGLAEQLNKIVAAETESVNKDNINLEVITSEFRKMLIVIVVISILLIFILGLVLTKTVVQRLSQLEEATKQVAAGNFDSVVTIKGTDEIAFLSNAFNQMTASLKEAKLQLSLQQQVLVSASKMSALGEMAGGVAHEINTPLAVIQMRNEQLADMAEAGELDVHELTKITSVIQNTVIRIGKIINGLKNFSRDGSLDALEIVSIQQIVDDTLPLCLERYKNNSVEFKYDPPINPFLIDCRPTQISQVILNLINNSFDAIQDQKTNKWVQIQLQETEDYFELAVVDSGLGISAEDAKKVMNPFFTTKAVGKGTGLGLSISLRIIEAHKGKIFYDSSAVNTRFVIQLPKITKIS